MGRLLERLAVYGLGDVATEVCRSDREKENHNTEFPVWAAPHQIIIEDEPDDEHDHQHDRAAPRCAKGGGFHGKGGISERIGSQKAERVLSNGSVASHAWARPGPLARRSRRSGHAELRESTQTRTQAHERGHTHPICISACCLAPSLPRTDLTNLTCLRRASLLHAMLV